MRTPLHNTFGNQINAYGMHTDAVAMCVLGFGFLYVFRFALSEIIDLFEQKSRMIGITFNHYCPRHRENNFQTRQHRG